MFRFKHGEAVSIDGRAGVVLAGDGQDGQVRVLIDGEELLLPRDNLRRLEFKRGDVVFIPGIYLPTLRDIDRFFSDLDSPLSVGIVLDPPDRGSDLIQVLVGTEKRLLSITRVRHAIQIMTKKTQ